MRKKSIHQRNQQQNRLEHEWNGQKQQIAKRRQTNRLGNQLIDNGGGFCQEDQSREDKTKDRRHL